MSNDVMKMTIHAIEEPKSGSSKIMRHGKAAIGAAIRILIQDLLNIENLFGSSPKMTARNKIPEIIASCDG